MALKFFIVPMLVQVDVFVWAESKTEAMAIAQKDMGPTPDGTWLQLEDYLDDQNHKPKKGDYAFTGNMKWVSPAGWHVRVGAGQ